ncbi:toxin YoeB [Planctomycetales bacterium]|nr:toxin YoeB [Planctomycetales bacterium]
MREISFAPKAWQDFGWWMQNEMKAIPKIYRLLENIGETPFTGLGQPEPLKANYAGYWSRRINLVHRLVYKVDDRRIVVHSLCGHYQT